MCEFLRSSLGKARYLVDAFMRETRGLAAVEFALVFPFLLLLYLGSVELTHGLTAKRKMSQVAASVGDLVSQYRTLDCNVVDDIFSASTAIMTPFETTSLVISVAGVEIDEDGDATVDWSRTNAGGTANALLNEVPDSLKVANSYLVVAKTDYTHQTLFSAFSQSHFGQTSFAMSDILYLRPRIGSEITYSAGC
ncbi:MAG: TadE/TadG family type IV pilus assembly protein [Pseudomonadota bacterium]